MEHVHFILCKLHLFSTVDVLLGWLCSLGASFSCLYIIYSGTRVSFLCCPVAVGRRLVCHYWAVYVSVSSGAPHYCYLTTSYSAIVLTFSYLPYDVGGRFRVGMCEVGSKTSLRWVRMGLSQLNPLLG